jgi:acyl-CoA thioester hydrolase
MKRVTSVRRYRVLRLPEEALLAEAETMWAFVDFATGQPARVPKEIADAFRVVAEVTGAAAGQ